MSRRAPRFRSCFFSLLLFWGGLSLGSSACAVSRDAIKDKLELSTQAYARAMRWGDWDAASAYVPEESAVAYIQRGESLREEVKVVDQELLALKYEPERGAALVRYELSWQRDREIVVRSTMLEEDWIFHSGKWYLVSHRRVSGEALELVGEVKGAGRKGRFSDPLLPGKQAFLRLRKKKDEKRKRASGDKALSR